MLKELNPLLHSQLRLAVMSILLSVDEADFVYLKEQTNATAGNLSVHLLHYRGRKGGHGGICGGSEKLSEPVTGFILKKGRGLF